MSDNMTHDFSVDQFQEASSHGFSIVLPYSDDSHQGASLSLKDFIYGWLVRDHRVGEINILKSEKYRAFSLEKAERPEQWLPNQIHYSTFKTREPEIDRYGGGILGFNQNNPRYGYGCSGIFPEHCDEALCLLIALKMDHLDIAQACFIAGISQNEIFMEIRSKIQIDSQSYFHWVCKI